MILPLEDRWGILSVLEYEHGTKKALLSLHRKELLEFTTVAREERESFLNDVASNYAVSCFRQGKEFLRQAEVSNWLVKPLLLYYGMLAVTKAGLVFQFPDYFTQSRNLHHGISAGESAKAKVEFENASVFLLDPGIYPLIRRALQYEAFAAKTAIPLSEIFTRLPETDGTYRLLFAQQEKPPDYVRITGHIIYRDAADKKVRLGFQLPKEMFDSIKDRFPDEIVKGMDIVEEDTVGGTIVTLRSKQCWENEVAASSQTPRETSTTLDNNTALILPMMFHGRKHRISEAELMFLAMFYFSSLARYQPHLWLEMHAGLKNLAVILCQQIIQSCENKFLGLVHRELQYAGLLPLVENVKAAN